MFFTMMTAATTAITRCIVSYEMKEYDERKRDFLTNLYLRSCLLLVRHWIHFPTKKFLVSLVNAHFHSCFSPVSEQNSHRSRQTDYVATSISSLSY